MSRSCTCIGFLLSHDTDGNRANDCLGCCRQEREKTPILAERTFVDEDDAEGLEPWILVDLGQAGQVER